MKEEFELDSRDSVLLETLAKSHNGLGFNELQRITGFPKNTVNRHLKTLVEENIVSREQLGELRNSQTIYKAIISDGLRSMAQMGLEIAINDSELDFEKMTKVQLISTIPHLLSGIAIYETIWMLDYITKDINKTEYRFAINLIAKYVDEIKEKIEKLLNEKNNARLKDEGWTVYANESFRQSIMIMLTRDYTKKFRTVNEIVRDLETPFTFTDFNGHYIGGGEKIPQIRHFKNKNDQEEYMKKEEEYIKKRNELAKLQSEMKNSRYFPISICKD